MNLFIVRHGQTDMNAARKICGRTNIDLNNIGINQAYETAKALIDKNITAIYSSPLRRALHTAEIISEAIGVNKIISDKRLVEQDYGAFEGADIYNEDFCRLRLGFAIKMPTGESAIQVAARAYSFLESLQSTNSEENVLIVSHGSLCRALRSYFVNMTNDEYFKFMPHNCEIMEFKL